MREGVLRRGRGEADFRWRGRDVSRVENFSDIVFALVLTLLTASSMPQTFAELLPLWRDLVAVAACLALPTLIWRGHYIYFRRYDLEDGTTILLNTVLLFLVLAFAYPLKFLTRFLVDLVTALLFGEPDLSAIDAVMALSDARWLVVIYSTGYCALFGVFALLYAHAGRLADGLELTPRERGLTRLAVWEAGVHMAAALVAIVLAVTLPAAVAPWSGWTYFAIIPGMMVVHWRHARSMAAVS